MKKSIITLLLLALVVFTGCNKKTSEETDNTDKLKPGTVIIEIGNDKYTKKDFDDSFNKLYVSSSYGPANVDLTQARNYKLKLLFTSQAVNDIIIRHFINEEAKKRNIVVSDEEINQTYNEIVQKLGGEKRLEEQLKVSTIDKQDFKKSLKSDIQAKKVIDIITKDISISDSELKNYYEANKALKFNLPESAKASHIFIEADPRTIEHLYRKDNPKATPEQIKAYVDKTMGEKKVKAQEVLQKVLANENNFDKIALENSDDKLSSVNGGNLGYFPKGKMLKEFDEAVFGSNKAPVNTVNKNLVQSSIGFHIIKTTDHRKAGALNFDSIKNDIREIVETEKKIEALTDFVNKKKKSANIKFVHKDYDENHIKELLEANKSTPSNQVTSDTDNNS